MIANLLVVAITLVGGWAAAYPSRRALGSVTWILLGVPVGLIGWSAAAMVAYVADVPWSWLTVIVGWGLYGAAVAAALHAASRGATADNRPVAWTRAGVVAAAIVAIAVLAVLTRWTAAAFDGLNSYEPFGAFLRVNGRFGADLLAERMVLVPALHAAGRFFGGTWTYAIYAVTSAVTVALAIWLPWRLRTRGTSPLVSFGASAIAAALMIASPQFRTHAVLVHGHSTSAVFLLLSVFGVLAASWPERRSAPAARTWLVVAGLSAAGLALARPDGLAYAFVPVAIVLALSIGRPKANPAWFFGTLLATVGMVVVPALATSGLWKAPSKISGAMVLGLVVLIGLAWAATWLLGRFALGVPMLTSMAIAAIVGVGATMGAAFIRPTQFARALDTMLTNLFVTGSWGMVWYFVLASLLVAALALPWRRASWLSVPLVGVVLFFCVAAVVHGLTHPGRLGWGDSFNRVAYHAIPLAFAFLGGAYGALAETLLARPKDAS